jgi:hypothetical protein
MRWSNILQKLRRRDTSRSYDKLGVHFFAFLKPTCVR